MFKTHICCFAIFVFSILSFTSSGAHAAELNLSAQDALQSALGLLKVEDSASLLELERAVDSFWIENGGAHLKQSFYLVQPAVFRDLLDGEYYLSLNYANTDKLQFLTLTDSGELRIDVLGDEIAFANRSAPFRLPAISIEVPLTKLVLIHAIDTVSSGLDSQLQTASQFHSDAQRDYLIYGLYFGLLFFLIAGSLLLLGFTGEASFFWYACYLFCSVMFLLTANGLGQALVWSELVSSTKISFWAASGMVISITLFAATFLGLKPDGQFFTISSSVVFVCVIGVCISLFYVHHGAIDDTFFMLASYQMLAVFWQAVVSYRKHGGLALYLVLGYLVLFPAIGVSILKFSGAIAPTALANHSIELSFLIEALLFSIGLGKKLQRLTQVEKAAEREIQTTRKRYLNNLIEAREQEKRDIGVLLHNSVAQTLSLIRSRLIQINKTEQSTELIDLSELADQTMQRVRDISHSTYPHTLGELGLAHAISQYAHIHLDQNEIDWRCDLNDIPMSDRENLLLYRILQECINNVVRHANASLVLISLHGGDAKNKKELSVIDDGEGFDLNNRGFGLATVKEYSEALGGFMQVNSSKESGTQIKVLF